MARPQSIFAGGTDYTGVPLTDILEHLRAWQDMAAEAAKYLENARGWLAKYESENPQRVRDGLDFITYFQDLLRRYEYDLGRLVSELPNGVEERHVETVRQMLESSVRAEGDCVQFKRRHSLDALGSTPDVRHTLAEIYAQSRDTVITLRDLSNVQYRLKALVGKPAESSAPSSDLVELKPNVWGIGLNLNELWRRAARWWSRRKS